MAHLNLKLPSLKVKQHSSSGQVQKRVVYRQALSTPWQISKNNDCSQSTSEPVEPSIDFHPLSDDKFDEGCSEGPSLHKLQREANASAWEEVRAKLLHAVVESEAMPLNQACTKCSEVPATLRCRKCGPSAFFCCACFHHVHCGINVFHVAEEWKNGAFHPKPTENPVIRVHPQHVCSTVKQVPMCCIDEDGLEHHVLLHCCECEPVTVTMVRARLWPATPRFPRLAFSFDLLDWVEALLLECQVAVRDFCGALFFKCPYIIQERRNIYSSMIDAAEEYRFMKQELRNPRFLCENLDRGNVCPACPVQGQGKVIVSMDGIFGLPRKRAAGESVRPPRHGQLFFHDQNMVDEYVGNPAKVNSTRTSHKGCRDFLAGSAIRSSTRFKALDETAVFGSVCRHEFPLLFFNLKHGERLAYAVLMAQKLHQKYSREQNLAPLQLYVMYDVACVLEKHLKKVDPQLLEDINLVVPSFHSYGHNASCQVIYSPLRCTGIGLSDGECVERLWSYLRRFSRMTKEMRPSHRIDVLTGALAHYARRTTAKLGNLLSIRYKRAIRTLMVSSETMESLLLPSEVPEIEKWIEEEKIALLKTSQPELHSWKGLYFHDLHRYYTLQNRCSDGGSSSSETESTYSDLKKLNTDLKQTELVHGISRRWRPEDPEYRQLEQVYTSSLQASLLSAIHDCCVKRKFLLNVKAKYADGQKIAKRLSSQITKETRNLKKLVVEYNVRTIPDPELSIEAALDPHSTLLVSNVSTKRRQDITQAYLRKKRSEEEIELLKIEMKQTLYYLEQKEKTLTFACRNIAQCTDNFSLGAHNILTQFKWGVQLCIEKTRKAFKVTDPAENTDSSDDEDVSGSGSDSDSDSS